MSPLVVVGAGLFTVCVLFRNRLEADPVTHILVELPLLALAGAMLVVGSRLRPEIFAERHANAVTLIAVFAILFWMLPRYIDASLVSPVAAAAKFVSIPVLVGGALAFAWAHTHPLLRGFLKANALSMLGVMAFLYTHAPARICNSYLVSDQERLGYGFLLAAISLALWWTVPLFLPRQGNGADWHTAFGRAPR